MRTILSLFLSALLFSSCEDLFSTTVEADPPPYDPQLVFHLLATDQDSTVQLILTRNFGILEPVRDEKKWYVSGATAEWWQNGQKIMTLTPQSSDSGFVYVGTLPQPLKPGDQYEVRVRHPDYQEVRSMQTMPAKFVADSARIRDLGSGGQFNDQYQIDFTIHDQPGVANYYEVSLVGQQYELHCIYDFTTNMVICDTVGIQEYTVYFDEFLDRNTVEGTGNTALISDQLFDGQAYKFQAKFSPSYYSSSNTIPYRVQIRNVTKEYYQWSRSYYQRYENEYEIFAEPITVFGNIENGLGIFGLATQKTYITK
jgi:hypothetical protein